jgi:4'-phosphopantetheinyl transferase
MPAELPHLRQWSKNTQNRCDYDDIISYWVAHDAITFLIDLKVYHPGLHDLLTDEEKEQELRYRPVISRQRYIVSRTILKQILLKILHKENTAEIILVRNNDGRILVRDQPHLYICLSYSGTSITITVGKMKIGCDIESVRPFPDNKITASPLFQIYPCLPGKERIPHVIHVWTLVESYAKLYDQNPYPLLNGSTPFRDAGFVSYSIDQTMIFSLASAKGHITDILVWLDV